MTLETTPSRIVYFGDSLSDHGAFHEVASRVLTVPVPPESAGYVGWFSNGEVQSGVTPDLLGASADVYAVGGAANTLSIGFAVLRWSQCSAGKS